MTTPVCERMRNPITPPKAKPWNRPQIRVKKWRERVCDLERLLHNRSGLVPNHEDRDAIVICNYIRDWIKHAEEILNNEKDPSIPFKTDHWIGTFVGSDRWDPHHVHPVIKMEDFA